MWQIGAVWLRAMSCDFLRGRAYQPYDVIFADPPYGENRLAPTLKAIMKGGWLAPDGYLLAEIEGLLRF